MTHLIPSAKRKKIEPLEFLLKEIEKIAPSCRRFKELFKRLKDDPFIQGETKRWNYCVTKDPLFIDATQGLIDVEEAVSMLKSQSRERAEKQAYMEGIINDAIRSKKCYRFIQQPLSMKLVTSKVRDNMMLGKKKMNEATASYILDSCLKYQIVERQKQIAILYRRESTAKDRLFRLKLKIPRIRFDNPEIKKVVLGYLYNSIEPDNHRTINMINGIKKSQEYQEMLYEAIHELLKKQDTTSYFPQSIFEGRFKFRSQEALCELDAACNGIKVWRYCSH